MQWGHCNMEPGTQTVPGVPVLVVPVARVYLVYHTRYSYRYCIQVLYLIGDESSLSGSLRGQFAVA